MKRLADFPKGEWIEAADRCSNCGGIIWVKADYVADDGNYGHVSIRTEHKEGCYIPYEMERYDSKIIEAEDFVGWEYSNVQFKIGGKVITAYKARSNLAPCSYCEEFIAEVPLMLFPSNGEFELDFCDDCVKELGLLNRIVERTVPAEDDDTEEYS